MSMTQQHSSTLDLLAAAVARYKVYGRKGIDQAYDSMSSVARGAFDEYLVDAADPLATFPGSPETRFKCRVLAMALGRPAVNDMGFMDLSEPGK